MLQQKQFIRQREEEEREALLARKFTSNDQQETSIFLEDVQHRTKLEVSRFLNLVKVSNTMGAFAHSPALFIGKQELVTRGLIDAQRFSLSQLMCRTHASFFPRTVNMRNFLPN